MEKVSWIEVPDDGICKMPISPCGLACDISGHTRTITVRPFRDSAITTKIKFYIVDKDTPFIPYATCFTDPDHLQHRDVFEEAGWTGDERYKNHKSKPLPIRLTGVPCGPDDPDVWENGGIYGVHDPLPCILNYPICCLPGDLLYFDSTPNVVVSGQHEEEVIPAIVGSGSVVVSSEHEEEVTLLIVPRAETVVGAEHTANVVLAETGEAETVVSSNHVDNVVLVEAGEAETVVSSEHEEEVVPAVTLPEYVYVTMPGVTDNHCNCAPFWMGVSLALTNDDPDSPEWRLINPLGIGVDCEGDLILNGNPATPFWSLSFRGPQSWTAFTTWDYTSDLVLTRTGSPDQYQCNNYPDTVTIRLSP